MLFKLFEDDWASKLSSASLLAEAGEPLTSKSTSASTCSSLTKIEGYFKPLLFKLKLTVVLRTKETSAVYRSKMAFFKRAWQKVKVMSRP